MIGVGGVGSVTAEMLTRCGIGKVCHPMLSLVTVQLFGICDPIRDPILVMCVIFCTAGFV